MNAQRVGLEACNARSIDAQPMALEAWPMLPRWGHRPSAARCAAAARAGVNTEQDALERRAHVGGRLRVGGDDLDALERGSARLRCRLSRAALTALGEPSTPALRYDGQQ
jgi:hypothetical protein